jgi:membrane protein
MKSFYISMKFWLRRIYRILAASLKAFTDNNDYLKASALTFYTLISLVPFLAVALGIAAGFGFEHYLEDQLKHLFEDQPDMIAYALQFAETLLRDTKGSLIAGIGLIALLWTNLSLLANIENALNDIWRVKTPRSWPKKLTDYLAAMILCPIFLVVSSSANVYLVTQITATAKESRLLELMSPFLLFLFQMMPMLLSILLFVVIYLFIPNAKLQTWPRIIAGVVAGIIFQLWQWAYIKFQVEISHYGAIYGTFAALPLFLIWLQVSWLIVLAGAELAAHIENEMAFTDNLSGASMRLVTAKELGLLIVNRCVLAFYRGEPPMNPLLFARDLRASLMSIQPILDVLTEKNILIEVGGAGSSQIAYQPRKDARLLTIKSICDAIDTSSQTRVAVENTPVLDQITVSLDEFDRLTRDSKANLNFQQLIIQDSEDKITE